MYTPKKAAQAADEAWQQTVQGHKRVHRPPTQQWQRFEPKAAQPLKMVLIMISEFTSAPPHKKPTQCTATPSASFHGLSDRTRLWRLKKMIYFKGAWQHLKKTLHSKGAWQQVTRIKRLVSHACLSPMALLLGRVCGKCPDAARLHHSRAEKSWQQNLRLAFGPVQVVRIIPGHPTRTRRNLQHRPKPLGGHYACVSCRIRWIETCGTQASPQNPEDSQKHNPDWLISFLPLSQKRGSGCVVWLPQRSSSSRRRCASSFLVVKKLHCRQPTPDLRGQTHPSPSPLFGQQMGDRTLPVHSNETHPAATAYRMSVESLQHRWKTRNPDSPPSAKSIHDTGSPLQPFPYLKNDDDDIALPRLPTKPHHCSNQAL